MFTLMTLVRKRPEISTERFREFMEIEYGPVYAAMPETRRYVHYYVSDIMKDDAELPFDAIVHISFDSRESMTEALKSDDYKRAQDERKKFMLDGPHGIRSALVDKIVELV
jgi:EthD domain